MHLVLPTPSSAALVQSHMALGPVHRVGQAWIHMSAASERLLDQVLRDIDTELAQSAAADTLDEAAVNQERMDGLIAELEPLCEDPRCATSPLLDGYWDLVYATSLPRWAPLVHVIESHVTDALKGGGGAPGIRSAPLGRLWEDVREGHGAYVQRSMGGLFGTREVRARYTWLGGGAWDVDYISEARLLFGVPLWRRRIRAEDTDLDHEIRPTYVDGDYLVLRSPAVTCGTNEMRPARTYLLSRRRHRLWQADEFSNEFVGMSDRAGFEP
jgi:hypothetical protein